MVQVHGGIGFTWEHDLHFYFKRAKYPEFALGVPAQHREVVAATLSAIEFHAGTVSASPPQ